MLPRSSSPPTDGRRQLRLRGGHAGARGNFSGRGIGVCQSGLSRVCRVHRRRQRRQFCFILCPVLQRKASFSAHFSTASSATTTYSSYILPCHYSTTTTYAPTYYYATFPSTAYYSRLLLHPLLRHTVTKRHQKENRERERPSAIWLGWSCDGSSSMLSPKFAASPSAAAAKSPPATSTSSMTSSCNRHAVVPQTSATATAASTAAASAATQPLQPASLPPLQQHPLRPFSLLTPSPSSSSSSSSNCVAIPMRRQLLQRHQRPRPPARRSLGSSCRGRRRTTSSSTRTTTTTPTTTYHVYSQPGERSPCRGLYQCEL